VQFDYNLYSGPQDELKGGLLGAIQKITLQYDDNMLTFPITSNNLIRTLGTHNKG